MAFNLKQFCPPALFYFFISIISLLVIITFLFILTMVIFVKFGVFDKLILAFDELMSHPIDLPSLPKK